MSIESEKERLYSDLFRDLKGAKIKSDDWITIALKCKRLVELEGPYSKVAEKLGVTSELLRSILTLLQLPNEVQQLIRNRKILYDAARRLTALEPKRATEVARIVAGLPSHKQREVINYAKRFPKSGLQNYTKRVTKQERVEKIYVAILPLKSDLHESLLSEAHRRKFSLEKLILEILQSWKQKHNF
jgi:hypothetical protein